MKSAKKDRYCTLTAAATCTADGLPADADLTGAYYATYGDANSYSLPINGLEVMAGPGQIDLYTKLGLQSQLGNPIAGMDDAFDTPSANNIEGFRMGSGNEPGSASRRQLGPHRLVGQLPGGPQHSLDLSRNAPVFFFANNETGYGDNLAGWARVELTHNGVVIGRYDLTNDDHDPTERAARLRRPAGRRRVAAPATRWPTSSATPRTAPRLVTDFLMSGGLVCADASGMVDCSQPPPLRVPAQPGGRPGRLRDRFPGAQRQTGRRARHPRLQRQSGWNETLANYALHVDFRLGCGPEGAFPQVPAGGGSACDPDFALNGGRRKVFIGTMENVQRVPEPASAALAANGPAGGFRPAAQATA